MAIINAFFPTMVKEFYDFLPLIYKQGDKDSYFLLFLSSHIRLTALLSISGAVSIVRVLFMFI